MAAPFAARHISHCLHAQALGILSGHGQSARTTPSRTPRSIQAASIGHHIEAGAGRDARVASQHHTVGARSMPSIGRASLFKRFLRRDTRRRLVTWLPSAVRS